MLSFLIISALSLVLLLSLIPFLINQKHIFHWWDSNRQSSDVNPFEVVAQTLWLLSHNLVLSTKRFDNSFQLDQELFLSLEQQKGQQVNDLPKLYGCVVIIQLMTVWCRAVISFLVFCTSGSFMFFSLKKRRPARRAYTARSVNARHGHGPECLDAFPLPCPLGLPGPPSRLLCSACSPPCCGPGYTH